MAISQPAQSENVGLTMIVKSNRIYKYLYSVYI